MKIEYDSEKVDALLTFHHNIYQADLINRAMQSDMDLTTFKQGLEHINHEEWVGESFDGQDEFVPKGWEEVWK